MRMGRMLNLMRMQAQMAGQITLAIRFGIITGYDPNTYTVKVQFPPDEAETGWIPLDGDWVGNGWGDFAPPTEGDQVAVAFQEGAQDAGFVMARFFDNANVPLPVNPGERWIVHKNGQFVKLTNDGKITVSDAHGAQVQMDGAGNIASQGNWTHMGSMTITQNMHVEGNTTVDGTLSNQGINVTTHGHQSTSPGTRTGNMEA